MSVLQYKYKAHRLVNTLFYVIVFVIGFLIGFGAKEIDFSKLLSQVLMIDNVSAEELDIDFSNLNYIPNSSNYNDEKFIISLLNEFNKNTDFNYTLEDYPYVYVYNINNQYEYYFYKFDKVSQGDYGYTEITFYDFLQITFVPSSSYYNYSFEEWQTTSTKAIDNVNSPNIINSPLGSTITNILDFKKYFNYKLNDGSIFEDENHLDFNKHCWSNFDKLAFSITIDSSYDGSYNVQVEGQEEYQTYIKSGFYVFDDISKLRRGTRIYNKLVPDYEFYSATWVSGITLDHLHNITDNFLFLDTTEKINSRYSDVIDALGNYDIERGDSYYFDNLDKLKNSHYVDFTYYYGLIYENGEPHDYSYDIFYLEESKQEFCIYIPKQFIVTTLELNELNGFSGDIKIHTDKVESFIDRFEESKKLDTNQLFSVLKQFIASIKDTVDFLNQNVFAFFNSLHPLLQMFIYSVLTLLLIRFIIWMVVK